MHDYPEWIQYHHHIEMLFFSNILTKCSSACPGHTVHSSNQASVKLREQASIFSGTEYWAGRSLQFRWCPCTNVLHDKSLWIVTECVTTEPWVSVNETLQTWATFPAVADDSIAEVKLVSSLFQQLIYLDFSRWCELRAIVVLWLFFFLGGRPTVYILLVVFLRKL